MAPTVSAAGDEPLSRFRALGLAYVEFARTHPSHLRVMFGRESHERTAHTALRAAADETFQLLLDSIRVCQRAGLVRDDDPEELAVSAWSMVHGFSALLIDDQFAAARRRSVHDMAAAVTRDLFLGLGSRERPSRRK